MKLTLKKKVCRPRATPYAMKGTTEKDLDRLQKLHRLEWAAPIVAVPKVDGMVQTCEDHKVMMNSELEIDHYFPHQRIFLLPSHGESILKSRSLTCISTGIVG